MYVPKYDRWFEAKAERWRLQWCIAFRPPRGRRRAEPSRRLLVYSHPPPHASKLIPAPLAVTAPIFYYQNRSVSSPLLSRSSISSGPIISIRTGVFFYPGQKIHLRIYCLCCAGNYLFCITVVHKSNYRQVFVRVYCCHRYQRQSICS